MFYLQQQRGCNKTIIFDHLMETLFFGDSSYETLSSRLYARNGDSNQYVHSYFLLL